MNEAKRTTENGGQVKKNQYFDPHGVEIFIDGHRIPKFQDGADDISDGVSLDTSIDWFDTRTLEEKAEDERANLQRIENWHKIEQSQLIEVSDEFAYDGTLGLLPGGIAQTAGRLIDTMMSSFLPLINWKVEVTHEEEKEVQPADNTIKYPHNYVRVIVRFIGPDFKGDKRSDG